MGFNAMASQVYVKIMHQMIMQHFYLILMETI